MELTMTEGIFVCIAVGTALITGLAIVNLLGLMIVKLWDRSRRKHAWYMVRRAR